MNIIFHFISFLFFEMINHFQVNLYSVENLAVLIILFEHFLGLEYCKLLITFVCNIKIQGFLKIFQGVPTPKFYVFKDEAILVSNLIKFKFKFWLNWGIGAKHVPSNFFIHIWSHRRVQSFRIENWSLKFFWAFSRAFSEIF